MKKLMIAAAIVCAAAMSQAASINWGGAIADASYGTSGATQATPATAVLIWSSEAFTGAATEIDKLAMGGVANNGGKVIDAYDITAYDAGTMWAFAKTYDKAGSGVDGYYAVLVGNGDGKLASYYDLGQVSGTTSLSDATDLRVNPSWTAGGKWTGNEFLEQGGYTVTVGAVPEPTSGLLLLIGVAGLALRRRRA